MRVKAWLTVIISAAITAGCSDADQGVAVDNDPVSTELFDVSAGLRTMLTQTATYTVSASDASGTVTVRLSVQPIDSVTLTDGSTANETESVNQTTAANGAVTESTSITRWADNPDNNDRVKLLSITNAAAGRTLTATNSGALPGPVAVNTSGIFYDGEVTESGTRLGLAEVRWSVSPRDAASAWLCTISETTFSAAVFSDCYAINPAGEMLGQYQSIIAENGQRIVFQ